MDTFQGNVTVISPAFGSYVLQTYLNIDNTPTAVTGMGATGVWSLGATGVAGTGTSELVNWSLGVTGSNFSKNNNISQGYYA